MNTKAKRGKWHDGRTTEPSLPGVYERQFSFGISYSRWTGKRWLIAEMCADKAAKISNESIYVSILQNNKWRGLRDKPEYVAAQDNANNLTLAIGVVRPKLYGDGK